MAVSKQQMVARRFESPDEHRSFPLGGSDVITLNGVTLGMARFEPGWRWSESLKQKAGTESCQVEHLGYVLSGHLRTRMDDGLIDVRMLETGRRFSKLRILSALAP